MEPQNRMKVLFHMFLLTLVEADYTMWTGSSSALGFPETPVVKVRSRLGCVTYCSTNFWKLAGVDENSHSAILCRCMNSSRRSSGDLRENVNTFRRVEMEGKLSDGKGDKLEVKTTTRPSTSRSTLAFKKSKIPHKHECPKKDSLMPSTSEKHLFQLHMKNKREYQLLVLIPRRRSFKKIETVVPGTSCTHIAIIANAVYFCPNPHTIAVKCMGKTESYTLVLKEKKKIIDIYADQTRKMLIYLTKVKSSVDVRLFILKNKRRKHAPLGKSFQQMALDVKQGNVYWLEKYTIYTMPYIWQKRFVKSAVVNITFQKAVHFDVCPVLNLVVSCERQGSYTWLHSYNPSNFTGQLYKLRYGVECRDIICFKDHVYVDNEVSMLQYDKDFVKTRKRIIKTADHQNTKCEYCGAYVRD